jgi:hypothetical protein
MIILFFYLIISFKLLFDFLYYVTLFCLSLFYLVFLAKGCLAEWLRHSSGTPQVLSSNPSGSDFQAMVKKNPLAGPVCQSTSGAARPTCGNGSLGNG